MIALFLLGSFLFFEHLVTTFRPVVRDECCVRLFKLYKHYFAKVEDWHRRLLEPIALNTRLRKTIGGYTRSLQLAIDSCRENC